MGEGSTKKQQHRAAHLNIQVKNEQCFGTVKNLNYECQLDYFSMCELFFELAFEKCELVYYSNCSHHPHFH